MKCCIRQHFIRVCTVCKDKNNSSGTEIDNCIEIRLKICLTHISLVSFLWDIGKQCRPRSDATSVASDQGLPCLLTECPTKS